jgi:glyoxylase-like metal-dependent hydrolase (beta-lactamase superfamily II)
LQLVHTPGHVSNHLCVLLREEGMLFTGDHVLQGTTPVILPPDGNMSDYLNSLTRLLELPLVSLAPAHGEMMLAPFTEIEKLIAHRLKREAKILGALRELGECSDDDLVQKAYDDVGSHLLVWAKKTMSAHLIKLEQDGLALFDAPLWKAVR